LEEKNMNPRVPRLWFCIITISALSAIPASPIQAASICGPGDHWVDACAAGTQTLRVHMEFGLDTNLDQLTDVEAAFDGTVVVRRGNPAASDPDNDPLHLDRMGSQILSMALTGSGGYADGWTFRAGIDQGLAATTGYILETDDPAVAYNRYDMVFSIDGTPFGTLHHAGSFFFSADVTAFPQVGADYKHLGAPFGTHFALRDQNDVTVLNMTDLFDTDFVSIGRPHFVITQVVPLPSTILFLMSGIAPLMLALGKRKRRPSCSA
jgi:hypothetical protein